MPISIIARVVAGGIVVMLATSAANAEALSPVAAHSTGSMTPQEKRQLLLDDLTVMDGQELALRREACVTGNVGRALGQLVAELGQDAVPSASDYCSVALRAAVRQGSTLRLFENLALQQLGLGNELAFPEQKQKLGRKPADLIANIQAAAEDGFDTFVDVAGRERPLACPLALEAGAAWAAAHGGRADPPGITETLAGKIVGACFDPAITEITIAATGRKLTAPQAGIAAGAVLAGNATP